MNTASFVGQLEYIQLMAAVAAQAGHERAIEAYFDSTFARCIKHNTMPGQPLDIVML